MHDERIHERRIVMLERYTRQMTAYGIGEEGQERINRSKVLVVGAGGLGSPVLLYLAGAGVGTIGIIDSDTVSVSNLHRQIIHPENNVGINKAESAKSRLKEINGDIKVITYNTFLTAKNAESIINEYDFVIDCVDNFTARFIINDTCVLLKKPFCHGGVLGAKGQVMTYVPGMGPCYRCIFEEIPEDGTVDTAATVGVLGPAVGIIGSIEALEAIKYITGVGNLLTGRMLVLDGLTMECRVVNFRHPSKDCRVCGENADITSIAEDNYIR